MMEPEGASLGSAGSWGLRLGQTLFSSASLFVMCLDPNFYAYTAFCFLVTVMGLVIPWSITLGLVDAYSLLVKCPRRQLGIMTIIVFGDSVLAFLQLGAGSSTASVTQILIEAKPQSFCQGNVCTRYSLSAAMAFFSCSLSMASSLFNFWLLPRL